jgi:Holliday junction DNA helicase RuvA
VGALPGAGGPHDGASQSNGAVRQSVVDALLGLGFATRQAEQAVDTVLAEDGPRDTSGLLRRALTALGRTR